MAEWLAYFPFDSSKRVRAALSVILFFTKLADWKVTEMYLPFSRLNGDWMVAEMRLKSTFPVSIQSPFSHHSVTVQSTERCDFILWMSKIFCFFWGHLISTVEHTNLNCFFREDHHIYICQFLKSKILSKISESCNSYTLISQTPFLHVLSRPNVMLRNKKNKR